MDALVAEEIDDSVAGLHNGGADAKEAQVDIVGHCGGGILLLYGYIDTLYEKNSIA